MRIFAYEFITGGGMWSTGEALPDGSLLREGAAMLRALTIDLVTMAETEVVAAWDARLPSPPSGCEICEVASAAEERAAIERFASASDGVIIIAPEIGGALLERVRWVEAAGGWLLSPGSEFVELAADKHATCRRLASAGVRTPHGVWLRPGDSFPLDFPYPAVLKPRHGAGSQDLLLVRDPTNIGALTALAKAESPQRLEAFMPGLAASVAVLCGPAGQVILPACRQRLSDDGTFRYLGGRLPLPAPLDRRAAEHAKSVLDAFPPAIGYVGIDLVLGGAEDGSRDAVIEVNPRLTTSYVGLRKSLGVNLAELMVQLAAGSHTEWEWNPRAVVFTADGDVHFDDSAARELRP